VSERKYVMFLDILGFSQLVSNNTPDQLKQIYNSEIHQTAGMCTLLSASIFKSAHDFKILAKETGELSDVHQTSINFHVLSDSLIAWTNDTTFESLKNICQYAATYLSMTLSLGLPHRGAISVGDIQLIELPLNGSLQSNVVGSGIVNAHNLEVGQEWMGCVVDQDCLKELSKEEIHELFRGDPVVLQCKPPFKETAKHRSNLAVNWTLFDTPLKNDREFFEEQFSRHNKGSSDSSNIKIQNTYEFYCKHTQINNHEANKSKQSDAETAGGYV
jgi:hypothetical protein